jgi:hypothetical protein
MNLGEILKSGSMSAINTSLSGTLTPEQSHNFIDVIKDNSAFLPKITVEKMGRLTKELDAWDVARGILVRVPSGERPTEEQRKKLGLVGCKLDAKAVQLFARILQDALEDNKSNPKFEEQTFESFSKAFGNDLVYLGFVGNSDTYDGTFETLNKGWIEIAKESSETTKATYAATESITGRLTAIAKSIHPDVLNDSVILISAADYQRYNEELSAKAAANILIEGSAKKVLGVPLEIQPFMPNGVYMATPLKNLVLGTVIDIRRNRWYDNEERALKYVFEVYCDYEIVVKKWVSLLTPAA